MKNDGVSLVIWNGTLNGCESGFCCENRINISCMKMNVDVFMCGTKKCEHFSCVVPGEISSLSLRFQFVRGNMLRTGINRTVSKISSCQVNGKNRSHN